MKIPLSSLLLLGAAQAFGQTSAPVRDSGDYPLTADSLPQSGCRRAG